ncbi:MAG: PD-(D/E)XK nuclease family protein [Flavobacteriales bacterium]|jgi:hypothetical protein|nr:PD-(D/E)XK nuclease family protein [Flavobacteriales bacterium]
MFQKLYNLYKSSSKNTPLEDFNTEAFVAILKYHPDIFDKFLKYIGLSGGNYTVETQVWYKLDENTACKPDIVIQNNRCICFIESKIHSNEGEGQLDNYNQVLNKEPFSEKHLIYCTKKHDPKSIEENNFRQYRWFHFAQVLIPFRQSYELVNDYINFLEQHNMTFDSSIFTDISTTQVNLLRTLKFEEYYIQLIVEKFKEIFPNVDLDKMTEKDIKDQLYLNNRQVAYSSSILNDSHWSELLFGINHCNSEFVCQIYLDKNVKEFVKIKSHILRSFEDKIKSQDYEKGTSFAFSKSVLSFQGENEEEDILKWFGECFESFIIVIEKSPNFDWNPNLLKQSN